MHMSFVRNHFVVHFRSFYPHTPVSRRLFSSFAVRKRTITTTYEVCNTFKKVCSKTEEKSLTTRVEFEPKSCTLRKWFSEIQWHLKPFSSRHCFSHNWQYQRSFCNPLDFKCFETALSGCLPLLILRTAPAKSHEVRVWTGLVYDMAREPSVYYTTNAGAGHYIYTKLL